MEYDVEGWTFCGTYLREDDGWKVIKSFWKKDGEYRVLIYRRCKLGGLGNSVKGKDKRFTDKSEANKEVEGMRCLLR